MKFIFLFAAASSLSASIAVAQNVSLHSGETVIVRLDERGATVERSVPAEPMNKYEAYALWRAQTEEVPPGVKMVPPGFLLNEEGPPNPPHPSNLRVKITMRRVPALGTGGPDNTILFLENGYGSTLRYRAAMRAGARLAATDVCDVVANRLGLEHWPYVIDQLDLSDLHLEQPDGAVHCQ